MELIIGSHVGFTNSNQLYGCVLTTIENKANTFMFYTGSTQSTLRSKIDDSLTYKALDLMVKNNININNVIVHAPYIINFANRSDERKYKFYIDFFVDELNRCNLLCVNKIVLHPGSAVNTTHENGILNISNALNEVISKTNNVTILLEYMAGKGNEIGSNVDELKSIIDKTNDKSRIGVCLDTCHMNDSGIDLNNFDEFLDEFELKIGINKIKCIHINDSLNVIGSHKDRHANIGYGTIGFNTLINLIYNDRIKNLPLILETPIYKKDNAEYTPYKNEIESIRNKKFIDFIQ